MRKNALSIFVLALAAMLLVFASCNKLSTKTVSGVTIPVTPDSVILKNRIIVIDSTKLALLSTTVQLAQGVYVYGNTTGTPSFIAGDIIIGTTGAGYLRTVNAVINQQNMVILNTTQARLEDVFEHANINFSTGDGNLPDATGTGYTYNISNATLFQDGTASATITGGAVTINPNWNFNMQFQSGTMIAFSAICQNATLDASSQMNVTATAADNINATTQLNSAWGRTIIWIGQLPIVVTTELAINATVSGSVNNSVNRTLSFTTNDTYLLGETYASGAWQHQYSFSHNSTLNTTAPAGATAMNVSCSIVPQMTVMIYGVACPGTSVSLNTYDAGNVSGANWDFSAGFTQQPAFNVSAAVLGYTVPDVNNTWNTDTVNYQTPYKIIKVSGDGQIGTAYQYLTAPIVVQVIDNNGNAQANVPVYFSVTSGGGTLSTYTVITNSSGFAQTNWQIGNPATTSQGAQAVVRMANGNQISGSPVTFIAL